MGAPSVAPVVVGVDGLRSSLTAVRLAAREAAVQKRPLRVVHALDWDQYEAAAPEGGLRRIAEELLNRAAALREARTAPLIVVNDGGLAAQTCLPIDACAVQVAARAGCCVLIARKVAHYGGPVLVGVDGSPGSDQALGIAFEAAANRDAELIIVRVWRPDSTPVGDDASSAAQLADNLAPCRRSTRRSSPTSVRCARRARHRSAARSGCRATPRGRGAQRQPGPGPARPRLPGRPAPLALSGAHRSRPAPNAARAPVGGPVRRSTDGTGCP